MVTSCVHLYIFLQHPFAISILSPFFDPEASFDGVPLYMAHPDAVPPQMAHPTVVPSQLSPPASPESDPLKASTSTSSSSTLGDGEHPPGGLETANIMEFHSFESIQRNFMDLFGDRSQYRVVQHCLYIVAPFWVSFRYDLGPQTSFLFSCALSHFLQNMY